MVLYQLGCQLGALSYKVKVSECCAVSPIVLTHPLSVSPDVDEDEVSNAPFKALPPDALIQPPHFPNNSGSLPLLTEDDRTSHCSSPVAAPPVTPSVIIEHKEPSGPTTNGNCPSTIQHPRLQMSKSDPNAQEGPLHTSKTM